MHAEHSTVELGVVTIHVGAFTMTYLEEMEAPKSIFESMVSTASVDIRWVDAIEDTGLSESPSISEWIAATCGLEDPLLYVSNPRTMVDQAICGFNLTLSSRTRLDPP
jgi:hypothetical protein